MSAKREQILAGLRATGVSVANVFKEVIPESEWEDCATELLALLNQIEADDPREEFKAVVFGAMAAIGFEPLK